MNTKLMNTNAVLTMTSREIAGLTGKEHKHVARDIKVMLVELELDAASFGLIYLDTMNRQQTEYALDRKLTETLLTGYSTALRYKVICRWHELEEQVKKPQYELNSAAALRGYLLAYTETVLKLENEVAEHVLTIEQQAPSVAFVESFVLKGFNCCLTDAWKGLGLSPNLFNKKLTADGILFKRLGSSHITAKQSHIDAGHFALRITEYAPQVLVTPKGLVYIAKKYKGYIEEQAK